MVYESGIHLPFLDEFKECVLDVDFYRVLDPRHLVQGLNDHGTVFLMEDSLDVEGVVD